jgi:hypothetical protein
MAGIQSSPPFSGKYTITCTDLDGIAWTTSDLDWYNDAMWVEYHITENIPFLANKVTVRDAKVETYR